jgi:membrane-associated phospholipid phosphatase
MYLKSRNGSYTNFDVSDRTQRKSLFRFAIPLLFIVTVVLFATHQSKNLCISVLFALILLIVSQVINLYVKSSLHVSFNIYLSALVFTVNYKIGIVALLFTGLLMWSRVKLERHTIKEVVFGLVIGLVISLLMLTFEGYFIAYI